MLKRFPLIALLLLITLSSHSYPLLERFFDKTVPVLKLETGGGKFSQGHTAILYFTSNVPSLEVSGWFQGKDLKAYQYKSPYRYRMVLGFSADDPGNKDYYLRIKAKDKAGNTADYHYRIYVTSYKFGVLRFTLKPKKVMMLMPDTIREDWKKIEDVVKLENDKNYIRGYFIKPAAGRVTMNFGIQEFINGEEFGRHRGLDIANATGTIVKASNSGIVRLAERLPAHGNAVVIDHGQGIYTYYAHLSKILVRPDQRVWKGEEIGLMGATGVATGPHLHFSVSLHNLRVDPLQWLNGVVKD